MRFLSYLFFTLTLVACSKPSPNTIVVGTIAGPETQLIETAKEVAEKNYGLKIKIVEFNDYNLPNAALQDGSLDLNVYQHLPYLKAAMLSRGYDLQAIGRTFVYPMAIYSKQYKTLADIPEKSIIAIPNDPSNESRALLLLEEAHLIKVIKVKSGVPKIASNPQQLEFKEMDAAQLPRVLPDVAAAVINTTFALPAGLNPTHNSIYKENKDSPYANVIVIRRDSLKRSQLELFVKALNSEEVKAKAKELFGDAAVPAW